jgi:hypothetical protein
MMFMYIALVALVLAILVLHQRADAPFVSRNGIVAKRLAIIRAREQAAKERQ